MTLIPKELDPNDKYIVISHPYWLSMGVPWEQPSEQIDLSLWNYVFVNGLTWLNKTGIIEQIILTTGTVWGRDSDDTSTGGLQRYPAVARLVERKLTTHGVTNTTVLAGAWDTVSETIIGTAKAEEYRVRNKTNAKLIEICGSEAHAQTTRLNQKRAHLPKLPVLSMEKYIQEMSLQERDMYSQHFGFDPLQMMPKDAYIGHSAYELIKQLILFMGIKTPDGLSEMARKSRSGNANPRSNFVWKTDLYHQNL